MLLVKECFYFGIKENLVIIVPISSIIVPSQIRTYGVVAEVNLEASFFYDRNLA